MTPTQEKIKKLEKYLLHFEVYREEEINDALFILNEIRDAYLTEKAQLKQDILNLFD